MTSKSRRRAPALFVIPVLAGSLALSGCTSTVDPGSVEKLVRNFVNQKNSGLTAKSVSCPSGVKQQNGTMTCKGTVARSDGTTENFTVTVHLTQGGKHGDVAAQDFHRTQ
jgi:hypothetical protein